MQDMIWIHFILCRMLGIQSRWLGLVTSIARILGGSSNPTGVRQCVAEESPWDPPIFVKRKENIYM